MLDGCSRLITSYVVTSTRLPTAHPVGVSWRVILLVPLEAVPWRRVQMRAGGLPKISMVAPLVPTIPLAPRAPPSWPMGLRVVRRPGRVMTIFLVRAHVAEPSKSLPDSLTLERSQNQYGLEDGDVVEDSHSGQEHAVIAP